MDLLDRLPGFDRWATERVLSLCHGLADADLDRDFDIGNRTIRRTLDHLLAAMEFWTGLMAGALRLVSVRPAGHQTGIIVGIPYEMGGVPATSSALVPRIDHRSGGCWSVAVTPATIAAAVPS